MGRAFSILLLALAAQTSAAGDDVASAIAQAQAHLNAGNRDAARPLLERVRRDDPGNVDLLLLDGFVRYGDRDLPGARALLEQVVAARPGHAEALFGLGSIAYDLGDFEEARRRLDACAAAHPTDVRPVYLLAEIHSHVEEFPKACEVYRRAIEIAKASEKASGAALDRPIALALQGLGLALYNLRDLDGSAAAYEESLARVSGDPETAYGLALVRMKSGQREQAIPLLDRAIAARPNHVGARYQRGLAREKTGDFGGAVEDFRAALALDPSHKGVMLNLGRALVRWSKSKEGEEAERLRREGEDLQKRFSEVSEVLDDIQETLRKATREPRNAAVKIKLCALYAEAGDAARSADQARRAASLRPELQRDPIVLGILRLDEGKVDEARSLFGTAIRMKPDFPDSYLFLSIAEERAGRTEEAARLRGEFRRRADLRTTKKAGGS